MVAILGLSELKTGKLWRCALTELMGTALLITVACGSTFYNASVLQISLAFGISVATVVWCTAHVSGGHINPAVTAGFLVTRKISLTRALLYILGQCIGATLGAVMLVTMTPGHHDDHETNVTSGPVPIVGTAQPRHDLTWFQAVSIESMITFVLLLTVFATCDGRRKGFSGCGPLAIGLSIVMGHLWAVPLTGAATNPAAAFGTALVSRTWNKHWVYWLGPLNGGMTAALLYDVLLAVNASKDKMKAMFTQIDYDDSNFDEFGRVGDDTNKRDLHVQEREDNAKM